jgi:hypothetical protein
LGCREEETAEKGGKGFGHWVLGSAARPEATVEKLSLGGGSGRRQVIPRAVARKQGTTVTKLELNFVPEVADDSARGVSRYRTA